MEDNKNDVAAALCWEPTQEEDEAMNLIVQRMKEAIDDNIMADLTTAQYVGHVDFANYEVNVASDVAARYAHVSHDDMKYVSLNDVKYADPNDTITTVANGLEGNDFAITVSDPVISAVTINNPQGQLIVRIENDGNVVFGDNIEFNEASQQFWDRIAEYGGQFNDQLTSLQEDYDEMDEDFDDLLDQWEDEQSQRLELQALVSDIAEALGVPEVMEYDIADHAAKMKEQLEAANKRIQELHGANDVALGLIEHTMGSMLSAQEPKAVENPNAAYERAMKIVRG